MKRRFMWRLAHPTDNMSVTREMTKDEVEKAQKENPTWIKQRILVIG